MNRTLPLALFAALVAAPVAAQAPERAAVPDACVQSPTRCVTVSFREAEIRDVIASFAEVSGYSIVLGSGITGSVTAEIRNQPWDIALLTILQAHGLEGRETHPGIIRVDAAGRLREREVQEPLVTRVFRINYTPVQELAASLSGLRSERGSIGTNTSTNMLIVTDTEANVNRIAALLGQ